jgi:dihydrofolate reductase
LIGTEIIISGHAIVSSHDQIADAQGLMPAGLRNEADWQQFQAELDLCDLIVLGRIGHQMFPNPKRRRRLVLSHQVQGLEQREDAAWWSPQAISFAEVTRVLLPQGGRVAVTGGRFVFDEFLRIGFNAFRLARAGDCRIEKGIPIFSECLKGESAEAILQRHGLSLISTRLLDAKAGVDLSLWENPPSSAAEV